MRSAKSEAAGQHERWTLHHLRHDYVRHRDYDRHHHYHHHHDHHYHHHYHRHDQRTGQEGIKGGCLSFISNSCIGFSFSCFSPLIVSFFLSPPVKGLFCSIQACSPGWAVFYKFAWLTFVLEWSGLPQYLTQLQVFRRRHTLPLFCWRHSSLTEIPRRQWHDLNFCDTGHFEFSWNLLTFVHNCHEHQPL